MCEDFKYPEELKQDEFDRLLRQMVKDRMFVERVFVRLKALNEFVAGVKIKGGN